MKKFWLIILGIALFAILTTCGSDECSYTGCSNPVYKYGWCKSHYDYASLTGDYY